MPRRKLTQEQALEGTIKFSERYTERGAYELFPEPEVVAAVPLSGDPVEDRKKICPCDRHHEDIARDGFCI